MVNREKIGARLIGFAWGVEIVAATIGLIIAVFIILSTRDQITGLGEADGPQLYMSMFLGGLPFIVVAIVELTKIPLVHATYLAESLFWRIALSIGLMLLMVVTFETMANGFERNFSLRNSVITNLRKEQQHLDGQAEVARAEVERLKLESEQGLIERRETEFASLNKEHRERLDRIQAQKQEARARYGDTAQKGKETELKSVLERIKEVIAQRDSELGDVDARYKQKTNQIGTNVDQQRAAFQQQIDGLREQLAKLSEREKDQLATVKDDPNIERQRQAEIARIREDHEKALSENRAGVEAEKTRLQADIASREARLAEIQKSIAEESNFFTEASVREKYQPEIDRTGRLLEEAHKDLAALSLPDIFSRLSKERDQNIDATNAKYDASSGEGNRRRGEIRAAAKAERDELNQRLRNIEAKLSTLTTDSSIDQASLQRTEERREIEERFEKDRAALTSREAELRTEIAQIQSNSQQQLQPILTDLTERETAENQAHDRRRAEIQARFDAELQRLSTKKAEIESLERTLTDMGKQRVEIRDHIAQQAQAEQIYRFAQYVYGVEAAADVTPSQVRTISFIWFGSLAAITAWTGTLLAFGGVMLRYGDQQKRRSGLGGIARSIRAFFLARAKRLRAPIIKEVQVDRDVVREVTKEVPVEKIVVQDVVREVPVDKVVFKEVPREIVRKEIVYLPFFTDDPELVQSTMDDQRAAMKGVQSRKAGSRTAKADADLSTTTPKGSEK